MGIREVMREYLDKITATDFEDAMAHYTDDVIAHATGVGPGSGVFEGKAAFGGYLAQMTEMMDSMKIREHDLLTSDDHAVVLNTMELTRGDKTFTTNRVVIYHFEGDKISELWMVDADQHGAAEFMS